MAVSLCSLLAGCQQTPTDEILQGQSPAAAEENTPSLSDTPLSPTPTPPVSHDVVQETAQAYQALDEGDYPTAITRLTGLLSVPELPNREALQSALARAYLMTDQPGLALELLLPLANSEPVSEFTALANGLAAQAYEADGQWQLAITAFNNYVVLCPETEPDIRWHLARLYTRAGDYVQAAAQYQMVNAEAFTSSRKAELLEEQATVLRHTGNYTEALGIYDTILGFAQNNAYLALVTYWQGDTLLQAGRTEEASALLLQAYQRDPSSYAAYLALQGLKKMQQNPLNGLQEAWTCYNVGQYAESALALDTFAAGGTETAETLYLRGLIAEKQGDLPAAYTFFDQAVQAGQDEYYFPEAWLARARVMAANGASPVESYRELAELYPEGSYGALALWRSALYGQTNGDWLQAEQDYSQLAQFYPQSEYASEAAFRAGLMAYANTDVSRAQAAWMQLADQDNLDSTTRYQVTYWLGIAALRLTGVEDAQGYWAQVAAMNPDGYYGLRAQDQLNGSDLVSGNQPATALPDTALNDEDWQYLEGWVSTWYSEATEQPAIYQDKNYRRASALWDLGWRGEALSVFTQIRAAYQSSPFALLSLARQAGQVKAYPVMIECANDIIDLARQAGSEVPAELLRLAYPLPYLELFEREGSSAGIDPLLLMALVKQESLFRADAVSSAGAIGLGQIMPATGSYIASQLGDSFSSDQLVLPIFNIRYSAWYLKQALGIFNGSVLPALAAYNAGPGAVQHWLSVFSFADDDLFYELVPYSETRAYLSQVYRNYRTYQRLVAESNKTLPQG